MIERQLWRCPRCGRRWKIPVGYDPRICPRCATAAAHSDAGAADFERYSRLADDVPSGKIRISASDLGVQVHQQFLAQLRQRSMRAISMARAQLQRLRRQQRTIPDTAVMIPVVTSSAPETTRNAQSVNQRRRPRFSPRFMFVGLLVAGATICAYKADDITAGLGRFGNELRTSISELKIESDRDGRSEVPLGTIAFAAAVVAGSIVFYLLPTIIALLRGHPSAAAIAVINLVFGWTLLGYVAALAWSLTQTNRQITLTVNYPPSAGSPPH
jgi:Superinfection immunity protein